MHVQQNDPGEVLEVFDADGRPTGLARPRATIHLEGDWHLAFHCWIVRDRGRQVVLQRRSLAKDTYGGCWDAAAAGHWRFGESAAEAAREIDEELGLRIAFDDLVYRGRERAEREFASGLIDREFHEVYVLSLDQPLSAYAPDPREVIGLAAFDVDGLIGLASGIRERLTALEAVPGPVELTRDDLVPYSAARLQRMLGRA